MIYTRYLKKITLGRIFKVALIAWSFYFVWGCTRPNKMYIGNKYSPIKIEVPPEIVKSKDCVAYKKFIHSLVRPGFVPSDDCPWIKVGKIGYFQAQQRNREDSRNYAVVRGLKLAIPREYLWLGAKDPDGVVTDGLYFMFKYPTFESASASGDQSMNVKVTMKPWSPVDDSWHPPGFSVALDDKDVRSNPYKYVEYDKEVGMNALVYKGWKKIYFTGDIFKPKEWMYCAPDVNPDRDPQCEGNFLYKGIYLDFLFSRRGLMENHWEIRKKIKQKLDEFHENGKKAPELRKFKDRVNKKPDK